MDNWTPMEVAAAIKGLSLAVVSICAGAYVIGKVADALKARWSK